MWDTWPEASVRTRQWMALDDAAHAVREPELQQLILALPASVRYPVVRESLKRCGTLRSVHPYAPARAPSTSLTWNTIMAALSKYGLIHSRAPRIDVTTLAASSRASGRAVHSLDRPESSASHPSRCAVRSAGYGRGNASR